MKLYKKQSLLSIILSLVLISLPLFAVSEFDLSSMSDEELLKVREALELEEQKRGIDLGSVKDGDHVEDSLDEDYFIGEWHCVGLKINDVLFELPNYKTDIILSIESDGNAKLDINGVEWGKWVRKDNNIVFSMQLNGELHASITDNALIIQTYGIDILMSKASEKVIDIPKQRFASKEDEFYGTWRVKRIVCDKCSLSPYNIKQLGFDKTLTVYIGENRTEILLSEDSIVGELMSFYNDGILSLYRGSGEYLTDAYLTDTGELVISLPQRGNKFLVHMTKEDGLYPNGIIAEVANGESELQAENSKREAMFEIKDVKGTWVYGGFTKRIPSLTFKVENAGKGPGTVKIKVVFWDNKNRREWDEKTIDVGTINDPINPGDNKIVEVQSSTAIDIFETRSSAMSEICGRVYLNDNLVEEVDIVKDR